MSNNSIIEHRANYYYVEAREEYIEICKACAYKKPMKNGAKSKASPYCKALILAILENWLNNKRGKGEDLVVYMSYPQWISAMYGMFGRNVIIDSIDELIGEGLISREPYKMFGRDSFQYRLNCQELNGRIRQLPERDPNDMYPSTSLKVNATSLKVNGSDLQVNASGLKRDGYPSKSKRNIDTTNNHTETTQEGTVSDFANAPDVASPIDPLASLPIDTIPSKSRKPRIKVTQERKTEPLLSPEGRRVWETWLEMPWNKGIPPKLTETAAKHCEDLSKVEITQDIMFKVRNFAKKNDRNGFYNGRSWELGHVVSEYPRWQSAGYQAQTDPSSPLQATIVDMDAERERVRIKNEQQLAKQQEMRRKRAELAKQGVNNG